MKCSSNIAIETASKGGDRHSYVFIIQGFGKCSNKKHIREYGQMHLISCTQT